MLPIGALQITQFYRFLIPVKELDNQELTMHAIWL